MKTKTHDQSNAVLTGAIQRPATANCKGITINATVTLSGGLRGTVKCLLDGESFIFVPVGRTEEMLCWLNDAEV